MYQLVLQFPADTIGDYDAGIKLEELLMDNLNDESCDVDGHDFGQGAMNIFIWTADAQRTFAAVRELLADHVLMLRLAVGYREEGADDFTSLWPSGNDHFELL